MCTVCRWRKRYDIQSRYSVPSLIMASVFIKGKDETPVVDCDILMLASDKYASTVADNYFWIPAVGGKEFLYPANSVQKIIFNPVNNDKYFKG